MNEIRYTLFVEYAEISEEAFKKYNGNIVDALFEKDRDSAKKAKTFSNKEEALNELKKHKCTYYRTSGFANIYFYTCEYWYIAKEKYDEFYEDYEQTGDCDFAEIKV